MKNLSFTLWMIFFPLSRSLVIYWQFLEGRMSSDPIIFFTNIFIWTIVACFLWEGKSNG
jgi:hypothetical protein